MSKGQTKPKFVTAIGLAPLEKEQLVGSGKQKLFIGIPRETEMSEKRVPLTPESVAILTGQGHRILIETKAGKEAGFPDNDYSEAGAEIAYDHTKVYEADTIIKVCPPTCEELDYLKPNQTVLSALHLPTIKDVYLHKLTKKKVIALAFEYMKDGSGAFPFVRSMSEIAGCSAMLLAGELLSNLNKGQGILLGGISGVPPAKVVILGAGIVGEFAARTAIGLGAEVKVFDNNIYKLMRLQNNVGARLFTSTLHAETVAHALETADVAIGAIHSKSGRTPVVVTEAMITHMKNGAVIMDISIDQGGCFETSEVTNHDKPTFVKHGVIHYGVPNIPSRVARTASFAISNILTTYLIQAGQMGGFESLLHHDRDFRHGVYAYKGRITNEHLAQKFGMKYTELDLLFMINA